MNGVIGSYLLISCLSFGLCDEMQKNEIEVSYNERRENGYSFGYALSDGQSRRETGDLEKINDKSILRVKGVYNYIGPNNDVYVVRYKADDKGFRASFKYSEKDIQVGDRIGSQLVATLIGGGPG